MDQPSAQEGQISVLVADDQALVRDLILSLLGREPDMAVESAEDLPGVLDRIRGHGPFDVVLLDFFMPGVEGLQGVERTVAANAGRPVLLMSGNLPPGMVEATRRLGVRGFLPKARLTAIAAAVRSVAAGGPVPPLPESPAPEPPAAEAPAAGAPDADPGLTEAERAILRDLAEGRPTGTLAAHPGDGEFDARLRTIFAKLGVRNRSHAILAAKRRGLV